MSSLKISGGSSSFGFISSVSFIGFSSGISSSIGSHPDISFFEKKLDFPSFKSSFKGSSSIGSHFDTLPFIFLKILFDFEALIIFLSLFFSSFNSFFICLAVLLFIPFICVSFLVNSDSGSLKECHDFTQRNE